jgi:hypothetical protein
MTKTSHPLRPNRRKTTAAFLVMGLTISIGADVVLPPPLNDNNSPAGAPGHPGGQSPLVPKQTSKMRAREMWRTPCTHS